MSKRGDKRGQIAVGVLRQCQKMVSVSVLSVSVKSVSMSEVLVLVY